jgi:hypothetical protein
VWEFALLLVRVPRDPMAPLVLIVENPASSTVYVLNIARCLRNTMAIVSQTQNAARARLETPRGRTGRAKNTT